MQLWMLKGNKTAESQNIAKLHQQQGLIDWIPRVRRTMISA